MSTAAIERYALRQAPAVAPALALAGLMTALFLRLMPDVSGKPLHEDEAVAGLVSARPLGDVLHTVVLERGGAPLHFLLAHVALRARSVSRRAALALRRLRSRDRAALLRPGTPPRRELHRADGRDARGDVTAARRLRDVRPDVLALRLRQRALDGSLRARARPADSTDDRSPRQRRRCFRSQSILSARFSSPPRRESRSGSGAAGTFARHCRCSRCRRSRSRCC